MNGAPPCRSAEEIVAGGEGLAKARPHCHKPLNDLTAVLICKLHQEGLDVQLEEAEQCIRCIRIAVDTGLYPDRLLN